MRTEERIKVHAYCGFYLNPDKLVFYGDPGECCWEDDVLVNQEDWDDGCVSYECPNCGAELTQDMDHFVKEAQHG